MSYGTMTMNGKIFVLVPQNEFEKLVGRHELPEFPPVNSATGNYPAIQATRVSMARDIIMRRQRAKLTQKELASAAKIRVETLNRIEKAKVTADTSTILKIDNALKRSAAEK